MLGMLLLSSQLLAQTRTVTGKVTDASGAPIAGASVQIKGTSTGTVTKEDGTFTISVPNNSRTLTVSAVGQASREISLGNQNTINVALQAGSQQNLQEVVVVGYTSTTKEAFTGSAKAVSGEQLNNKAVSNPTQALAGEVSGVRVINTSGQPGTVATVRIRGIGSVNGNRDPLYVVDGVPFSGAINAINPGDIASIASRHMVQSTSAAGLTLSAPLRPQNVRCHDTSRQHTRCVMSSASETSRSSARAVPVFRRSADKALIPVRRTRCRRDRAA